MVPQTDGKRARLARDNSAWLATLRGHLRSARPHGEKLHHLKHDLAMCEQELTRSSGNRTSRQDLQKQYDAKVTEIGQASGKALPAYGTVVETLDTALESLEAANKALLQLIQENTTLKQELQQTGDRHPPFVPGNQPAPCPSTSGRGHTGTSAQHQQYRSSNPRAISTVLRRCTRALSTPLTPTHVDGHRNHGCGSLAFTTCFLPLYCRILVNRSKIMSLQIYVVCDIGHLHHGVHSERLACF